MTSWPEWFLPSLSLALLAIGLMCMITQRRVAKQIIGLSIMLQGALVAILDAGAVHDQMDLAQSMVISALLAEAIVLSIGLALLVNVFRYHHEGWVDDLSALKG